MRGDDQKQAAMFSYLTLAQRIPADHPARQMRGLERADWFYRTTIMAHSVVRMRRLIPIQSLAH